MAYTYSIDMHTAEIHHFLYTGAGPVVQATRQLGRQVQRVAQRRAPSRTGRLATSIGVVVNSAPGFVYADIGTPLNYGLWQHEGTGIYGPTGHRIFPRRAKALRFTPGRSVGPVGGGGRFRRGHSNTSGVLLRYSVKGIPGQPFLVEALFDVMARRSGRQSL